MQSLGQPFTILPSVDSTNNYAMQQVHARLAKHGEAWLALEQTRGKGQRGKEWIANKGENIYLSLVVEPHFLTPDRPFGLIAAVALATYRFVKSYAGEKTSIKWPNDIYIDDRKAVGILIENVIQSNKWLYAVIGIGVNVNQTSFPENLKNPTSIKLATGLTFDIIDLARELCIYLTNSYEQLQKNLPSVLNDYQEVMYKREQAVVFKKEADQFNAVIKGITPDGKLITNRSGENDLQEWGTVEWMIEPS